MQASKNSRSLIFFNFNLDVEIVLVNKLKLTGSGAENFMLDL